MPINTAEDLYRLVLQLPVGERLQLVERIAHDLSQQSEPVTTPVPWSSLAGAAPNLLGGEDAQAWVNRSRGESDEAREQALGRKP